MSSKKRSTKTSSVTMMMPRPAIKPTGVRIQVASAFQKAILLAITLAEARIAHRDACPVCHRLDALASISKRGVRIGRICTHCWRISTLSQ